MSNYRHRLLFHAPNNNRPRVWAVFEVHPGRLAANFVCKTNFLSSARCLQEQLPPVYEVGMHVGSDDGRLVSDGGAILIYL